MNRVSTKIKSIALSLALLTSTVAVFAESAPTADQAAKPCGAHKMHRKGCNILGQLNLTDTQRQQLKAQHETFRQENATAIADMKAKFQQLRALPKTPENQTQRDQLKAELKQSRKDLHEKHVAQLRQVLTPEQLQKYEALKQQCKADWKKKHQDAAAPKQG
jgi:Spy/CpxP family protein refolding chaperone